MSVIHNPNNQKFVISSGSDDESSINQLEISSINSINKNIEEILKNTHSVIRMIEGMSHREPEQINMIEVSDTVYYPKQLEQLIINCIKTNDSKTLDFLIQIIKDENFIIRSISKDSIATLHALIINTIYKFTNSTNPFDEYFRELNYIVINYNGNYHEFINFLSQFLHLICNTVNKQKITKNNTLVNDITTYLTNNYHDCNLGLGKIAETFNLSEGYISTLFKEQTKTSFTDYIEALRINEACKLLAESDKAVNEIAITIGYSNVYSFRRAFKRKLNLGPKEYRTSMNKPN